MSAPRNQENVGLPKHWQFYHGAYYYRVPPGLEAAWGGKRRVFLGRSLEAAFLEYFARTNHSGGIKTSSGQSINQLLDRYSREVVPTKALTTQRGNAFLISRLKTILGTVEIGQITLDSIYQYFDSRDHKVAAAREIEVLSHAYTKAVEWGYISRHPFKGEVRLPSETVRNRTVEDWEVIELLSLKSRQTTGSVRCIQAYIRLKVATGLRLRDLLRLRVDDIPEGLRLAIAKTRPDVIFEMSPEILAAVEMAKAARPVDRSEWLFCNRDGECYINESRGTVAGWRSMWRRFMYRVLAETGISEPFHEGDLGVRRKHPFRGRYSSTIPEVLFVSSARPPVIYAVRRKKRLRDATPPWADRLAIEAIYETARTMSRESKTHGFVVDHIIPLAHSLVCGLHVPSNLRVISLRANAQKNNRFAIE